LIKSIEDVVDGFKENNNSKGQNRHNNPVLIHNIFFVLLTPKGISSRLV
jgi:hypothetical protein